MKLLPDEIHFDCPNCKRPMSGDKALLGVMINCPDCREPFFPVSKGEQSVREDADELPEKTRRMAEQKEFHHREAIGRIRSLAWGFTVGAIILAAIAIIIALGSAFTSISGESSGNGFFIAGAFLGAALWLFLIAQIIYIRANTEK